MVRARSVSRTPTRRSSRRALVEEDSLSLATPKNSRAALAAPDTPDTAKSSLKECVELELTKHGGNTLEVREEWTAANRRPDLADGATMLRSHSFDVLDLEHLVPFDEMRPIARKEGRFALKKTRSLRSFGGDGLVRGKSNKTDPAAASEKAPSGRPPKGRGFRPFGFLKRKTRGMGSRTNSAEELPVLAKDKVAAVEHSPVVSKSKPTPEAGTVPQPRTKGKAIPSSPKRVVSKKTLPTPTPAAAPVPQPITKDKPKSPKRGVSKKTVFGIPSPAKPTEARPPKPVRVEEDLPADIGYEAIYEWSPPRTASKSAIVYVKTRKSAEDLSVPNALRKTRSENRFQARRKAASALARSLSPPTERLVMTQPKPGPVMDISLLSEDSFVAESEAVQPQPQSRPSPPAEDHPVSEEKEKHMEENEIEHAYVKHSPVEEINEPPSKIDRSTIEDKPVVETPVEETSIEENHVEVNLVEENRVAVNQVVVNHVEVNHVEEPHVEEKRDETDSKDLQRPVVVTENSETEAKKDEPEADVPEGTIMVPTKDGEGNLQLETQDSWCDGSAKSFETGFETGDDSTIGGGGTIFSNTSFNDPRNDFASVMRSARSDISKIAQVFSEEATAMLLGRSEVEDNLPDDQSETLDMDPADVISDYANAVSDLNLVFSFGTTAKKELRVKAVDDQLDNFFDQQQDKSDKEHDDVISTYDTVSRQLSYVFGSTVGGETNLDTISQAGESQEAFEPLPETTKLNTSSQTEESGAAFVPLEDATSRPSSPEAFEWTLSNQDDDDSRSGTSSLSGKNAGRIAEMVASELVSVLSGEKREEDDYSSSSETDEDSHDDNGDEPSRHSGSGHRRPEKLGGKTPGVNVKSPPAKANDLIRPPSMAMARRCDEEKKDEEDILASMVAELEEEKVLKKSFGKENTAKIVLTLSGGGEDADSLYSRSFKVDRTDPEKCAQVIKQEIVCALSEDQNNTERSELKVLKAEVNPSKHRSNKSPVPLDDNQRVIATVPTTDSLLVEIQKDQGGDLCVSSSLSALFCGAC